LNLPKAPSFLEPVKVEEMEVPGPLAVSAVAERPPLPEPQAAEGTEVPATSKSDLRPGGWEEIPSLFGSSQGP